MALLDPTINLMTKYSTYIHTESNHPPDIIKHIPAFTENCLSNRSSTEILFKESTKHYKYNLCQSGCNKKLIHKPTDTNH